MFSRMALNALDGMMANQFDLKSPFGAMLNEIGDGLSDVALYLPFIMLEGATGLLAGALVIGGLVVEITGLSALLACGTRRFDEQRDGNCQ